MESLGRLIRTLKQKCPSCTRPLQLRARRISSIVRGIEVDSEEEYETCSVCNYEREIPLREKKKRVEHVDKTAYVKEPVEDRKRRYNNAPNSKSTRPTNDYGKTSGRSPRINK